MLAARLEELLSRALSKSGSGGRVRPDAGMLAGLSQGAELLAELLPNAGAGVLPHISLTGLVRDELVDGVLNSFLRRRSASFGGGPGPRTADPTPGWRPRRCSTRDCT